MTDFDDARRVANSPEFDADVRDLEDTAAQYGVTPLGSTKEIMIIYRRSGSPPATGERRKVLKFEYLPNGADAEHTLLRTKNPEAVMKFLGDKYSITYTRAEIESGNITIVDKANRWQRLIQMAAEELGVEHQVRYGEAKFL